MLLNKPKLCFVLAGVRFHIVRGQQACSVDLCKFCMSDQRKVINGTYIKHVQVGCFPFHQDPGVVLHVDHIIVGFD